jgi:hypothetical protein
LLVELRGAPKPRHPHLGPRDITCIDALSSPYPSVSTVPGHVCALLDVRLLPDDTESGLHQIVSQAAARAWADWPEPPSIRVETPEGDQPTYTGLPLHAREFAPGWWTEGGLVTAARGALASVGLDDAAGVCTFCTNGSLTAGLRALPTIVSRSKYDLSPDLHVPRESVEQVVIALLDSVIVKRPTEGQALESLAMDARRSEPRATLFHRRNLSDSLPSPGDDFMRGTRTHRVRGAPRVPPHARKGGAGPVREVQTAPSRLRSTAGQKPGRAEGPDLPGPGTLGRHRSVVQWCGTVCRRPERSSGRVAGCVAEIAARLAGRAP